MTIGPNWCVKPKKAVIEGTKRIDFLRSSFPSCTWERTCLGSCTSLLLNDEAKGAAFGRISPWMHSQVERPLARLASPINLKRCSICGPGPLAQADRGSGAKDAGLIRRQATIVGCEAELREQEHSQTKLGNEEDVNGNYFFMPPPANSRIRAKWLFALVSVAGALRILERLTISRWSRASSLKNVLGAQLTALPYLVRFTQ